MRTIALCLLVACGARDDQAKTTAFMDSYEQSMKKISAICSKVSEQVRSGKRLTPRERASYIIVYGRAAAAVKLEEAPASFRACGEAANEAFAKLRATTADVVAHASDNGVETVGRANTAAPAVEAALGEIQRVAASCKRDTEQLGSRPLPTIFPYFAFATFCL